MSPLKLLRKNPLIFINYCIFLVPHEKYFDKAKKLFLQFEKIASRNKGELISISPEL